MPAESPACSASSVPVRSSLRRRLRTCVPMATAIERLALLLRRVRSGLEVLAAVVSPTCPWPCARRPCARRHFCRSSLARPRVVRPSRPEHRPVAIPAGFEPATLCLEGRCSIRLSYGTSVVAAARRNATRIPSDTPSPPRRQAHRAALKAGLFRPRRRLRISRPSFAPQDALIVTAYAVAEKVQEQ